MILNKPHFHVELIYVILSNFTFRLIRMILT